MKPMHNRKIVLGAVALTLGSMQADSSIMKSICDDLEQVMISSGYLENAPFLWVGMVFRYGLKNETVPHYQRINKRYGDLPLAMELDMRVLLTADENDPDLLKEFFEIATLDALIHAGKKYKLPTAVLEQRRAQLGRIPDWEYDMEDHPGLLFERYEETKQA